MKEIKVLLIEKNVPYAKVLTKLLEEDFNFNFNIKHFEELSKGFTELVTSGIDIALLDISQTDCVWLDTVKKIKFNTPYLPIIFLTETSHHSFTKYGAEVMQNFLVKEQFDSKLLVNTILNAVEHQLALKRLSKHLVKG